MPSGNISSEKIDLLIYGPSKPIVWIACAPPSQWQGEIRLVSFRAIC